MDRLRENYRDGERFYATDMNQMTHVINELGDQVGEVCEDISELEEKVNEDKIKVVRELPEEGEKGVIYSIPKEGTYDKAYGTIKREDDVFFPSGGIDYEGREFKVGDVIKIVNSAETSIVVNSVDENELSFDENTGINGITQWRTVENDCTYEITNIYRVTDTPIEMSYIELYVLTFTKVNSELYNFVLEDIPSCYYYAEEPSSERISLTLGLDEGVFRPTNPYMPIEYEVGDIVRFTGTGTTDIIPTEVDETNLAITINGNINGILNYSNIQTGACYEVTGVYDLKFPAEDLPDDMKDMMFVLKLFTFRKVSQQARVDYEVELIASVYESYWHTKIDRKSEYFWTGDHYEMVGEGGNVSSESITKMWVGTQNEYDNLDYHESDTLYIIRE